MARSTDDLVVVRSPFFAGTRMVGVGEVWAASDPVVKNYPRAFKVLEVKSSTEPKRSVVRPAPRRTSRSSAKKATTKK